MIFFGICASIVIGEYYMKNYMSKHLENGKKEEIANKKIILRLYHNKGAALDSFSKYPRLLFGFTSIFIGYFIAIFCNVINTKGQYMKKLALSLLIGGALSNWLDRMTKGYVIDYFSFSWKKIRHIVFNIADFCVFIGMLLLFFNEWRKK